MLSILIDPFGVPLVILCDQDGSFEGKVADSLTVLGVQRLAVPTQGHYDMGDIERNNAVWRQMLVKTIDAMQATQYWDIDVCVSAVNNAKNQSTRRGGRSPEQDVFGRVPRMPQSLLSDEPISNLRTAMLPSAWRTPQLRGLRHQKLQQRLRPVHIFDEQFFENPDPFGSMNTCQA